MKNIYFPLVLLILLPVQKTSAQWAGSTFNSGTEKTQINVNNDQQKSKGRFNLGVGIGGYANSVCKNFKIDQTNITRIISELEPTEFNLFLSALAKTRSNKVLIGFEGGLGTATKQIHYEYYSNNIVNESYVDIIILQLGAAIPVRYNLVETKLIDLYVQAVMGYGLLIENNDVKGGFYGGGAFGGRWTILFAELGYNTTGFLRFGLSIPLSK